MLEPTRAVYDECFVDYGIACVNYVFYSEGEASLFAVIPVRNNAAMMTRWT